MPKPTPPFDPLLPPEPEGEWGLAASLFMPSPCLKVSSDSGAGVFPCWLPTSPNAPLPALQQRRLLWCWILLAQRRRAAPASTWASEGAAAAAAAMAMRALMPAVPSTAG
jgi:hypothetical protein